MAAHPSRRENKIGLIFFDNEPELEYKANHCDRCVIMGNTTGAQRFNASTLVNHTKEEARFFIIGNVVVWDGTDIRVERIRVINRNGMDVPVLNSYDPNRLNVGIDQHIITKVYSMG